MRRIALFVCVGLLVLSTMEAFRAHWNEVGHAVGPRENTWIKVVTRVSAGKLETIKIGTAQFDINGKTTTIDFPGTYVGGVTVRLSPRVGFVDNHLDGIFWVTIPASDAPLLTREKYEKLKPGMKYADVGEAIGGVVAKGRMTDGFWSAVELIEGKRHVNLIFADGTVTGKTAEGLESLSGEARKESAIGPRRRTE